MAIQYFPNYTAFTFASTADYFNSSVNFSESTPLLGQCKWSGLNTALVGLLLLTLILNVSASIVLFRVPLVTVRGRSNPVYLCIRFLNISDVVQALLLLVMPAFASPDCNWFGGVASCKIMGFMALFLLLVSPLITILMAFDRVIALYQPFKYRSHLGLKILKILLPFACLFVFLITILPIFGVGEYHVVRGRRFCLLDTITDDQIDRIYVIVVHGIFLLALLFMAACTVTFQHKPLSRKKPSGRRTRNATITTMAVCAIFIVCYMPYVIRVLTEASTGSKSPGWITWITFGLAFMQPLLNPVVYVSTNVKYRQELQILLRNMKRLDLETSSDSATGTSRGAFSEFRRRFSNSGHRKNSKRGSIRGKEIQGSITSPGNSTKAVKNGVDSTRPLSWLVQVGQPRSSSNNSDVFEEGYGCHPSYTAASLERRRATAAAIVRREPSSSSGIRSFDSHEQLAPPQLHLKNQLPNTFGRLGRTSEEAPAAFDSPCSRERSNTVSGDRSPALASTATAKELKASQCSSSVPLLSANSDNTAKRFTFSVDVIAFEKSPRASRRASNAVRPADASSSGDGYNKCLDYQVYKDTSCTSDSIVRNCDKLSNCICTERMPSLKSRNVSVVKKPSHRDSGVMDTSDPSA